MRHITGKPVGRSRGGGLRANSLDLHGRCSLTLAESDSLTALRRVGNAPAESPLVRTILSARAAGAHLDGSRSLEYVQAGGPGLVILLWRVSAGNVRTARLLRIRIAGKRIGARSR